MAKKACHSTDRRTISEFEAIINIGAAMADDFRRLGYEHPAELIGQDPLDLYQRICREDGHFHDPCVLDVFMATIDFMNGHPPRQWWEFTSLRKQQYSAKVAEVRGQFDPPS